MTPQEWRCRDCRAVNEARGRFCEACGSERPAASRSPEPSRQPSAETVPPCTFEQNQRASVIVRDVFLGAITAEEGERRMAELFASAPGESLRGTR